MTNLSNYTRQFSLKETLQLLGLLSFKKKQTKSQKVGVGFLKYKSDFERSDNQLDFVFNEGDPITVLKNAITNDLTVYVENIDTKAQIKSSSSYIKVLLSNEKLLGFNTNRVFNFLKKREKRYADLIKYSDTIKKICNGKSKDEKLFLRLNSLNEVPNANTLQFNRLLDDIIENLLFNQNLAQKNYSINNNAPNYNKKSEKVNQKWGG